MLCVVSKSIMYNCSVISSLSLYYFIQTWPTFLLADLCPARLGPSLPARPRPSTPARPSPPLFSTAPNTAAVDRCGTRATAVHGVLLAVRLTHRQQRSRAAGTRRSAAVAAIFGKRWLNATIFSIVRSSTTNSALQSAYTCWRCHGNELTAMRYLLNADGLHANTVYMSRDCQLHSTDFVHPIKQCPSRKMYSTPSLFQY